MLWPLNRQNAHWLLGKYVLSFSFAISLFELFLFTQLLFYLKNRLLLESRGNDKNSAQRAFKLFKKAADKGLTNAEFSLALAFEYGHGVDPNFELAATYYKRATEKNHVDAMYHLALMYAYGRGIPQDFNRARPLLETAALANHAPSIFYIGVFKSFGYGCQVDYHQAINWFERAAGLDDFRVTAKALKAVEELTELVQEATAQNDEIIDAYQRRIDTEL